MHGSGHIRHIAAHHRRRYGAVGGRRVGHADFDFLENIIKRIDQALRIIGEKIVFGLAGTASEVIQPPLGESSAKADGKGFDQLVFINALAVAAFDIIGMAVPIFAAA